MKIAPLALALILLTSRLPVFAETLTTEGVQGEVDKERRGPVLTVEPIRESGQVRLLADAYTPFKEYMGYPFKFEFYVNRELKLTQIRSKELSGPVGITIPSSMAPIPFNYSVVVTLLAPNRGFTTYLAGAVYDKTIALTAPCTAIFKKTDGATGTYSNTSSDFRQSGQSSMSFDIELTGTPSYNQLDISGDIVLSSSNHSASSSITTSIDGKVVSLESTGSYSEADDGSITGVTLTSTDESLQLSCK